MLRAGIDVFANEIVKTAENSAAVLVFQDKTELSIGADPEIVLDRLCSTPTQTNQRSRFRFCSASRATLVLLGFRPLRSDFRSPISQYDEVKRHPLGGLFYEASRSAAPAFWVGSWMRSRVLRNPFGKIASSASLERHALFQI